MTDLEAYELSGGQFSVYGFEYKAGYDDAVSRILLDRFFRWLITL